jgi:serine/threonine-protein kinase 24/25/MST4
MSQLADKQPDSVKPSTSNRAVKYTKLERIGKGSFGEVFKGIDQDSGEIVAIKVLNLDATDDDLSEIRKEISVLSRCDSEYITRYHGSYLVQTQLWIVVDYAGGGSVRMLMKPGPISDKFASIITRDITHALVYLHRNGIIHRDIKGN